MLAQGLERAGEGGACLDEHRATLVPLGETDGVERCLARGLALFTGQQRG